MGEHKRLSKTMTIEYQLHRNFIGSK